MEKLTEGEIRELMKQLNMTNEQLKAFLKPQNMSSFRVRELKIIGSILADRFHPRFNQYAQKSELVKQINSVLFANQPHRHSSSTPSQFTDHFSGHNNSSSSSSPANNNSRSHNNSSLFRTSFMNPSPSKATTSQQPSSVAPITQQEFDAINAAMSPFYTEITRIATVRTSAMRYAKSSHHQYRFEIDSHIMQTLQASKSASKRTHALHVRFFLGECDWQWIYDITVLLNGKSVDTKPLAKKIRTNLKEKPFLCPFPLDITNLVGERNSIEFYSNNWHLAAIMVIQLVIINDIEDIIHVVPRIFTTKHNKKSRNSDELEETKMICSLMCPLSLVRLEIPAKGRTCNHYQCFDLRTFIKYSHSAQVWMCPVCQHRLPFYNIVVDEFMSDILENTDEDVTQIEIETDGTWRRPEASEEPPRKKRRSGSSSFIELCDDDDDNDDNDDDEEICDGEGEDSGDGGGSNSHSSFPSSSRDDNVGANRESAIIIVLHYN